MDLRPFGKPADFIDKLFDGMAVMLLPVLFLFVLPGVCVSARRLRPHEPQRTDMSNQDNVEKYLQQFGYLGDRDSGSRMGVHNLTAALLKFQQKWSLPVTGQVSIMYRTKALNSLKHYQ